ncbi:MAG: ABC transporter permease, partial [Bacteroidales bacterium]
FQIISITLQIIKIATTPIKMNIALFIARKIFFSSSHSHRISKPISVINIVGIAISFFVMFIAISVVVGFKQEIKLKVRGFASDIVVNNYDANYSYETKSITITKEDVDALQKIKGIRNIQLFATKPGIIKAKTTLHGIVLKGVYKDYDWSFLRKNMIEGSPLTFSDSAKSNQIVISKKISQLLQLKIGDPVFLYFIQNPPRMRKFKVCGIYETMLEDFDNMFVFVDLRHVQKLNDWNSNQISGYEINIHHFDSINNIKQQIFSVVGSKFQKDGTKLKVTTVMERFPYIFDWIGLFNTNLWVILLLMMIISGFNIISGLLVLVLERINMIGILKTVGFFNSNIRKIFIYLSLAYIFIGLVIGNILSFIVYFFQNKYHFIHLDKVSYYIDYVPMKIEMWQILSLNGAIVLVTLLFLIVSSSLISKIEPVKAIKFD